VILLLFSIGLELSGDQLKRMGPLMFGGGALQVLLTVVAVTGRAACLPEWTCAPGSTPGASSP
jgi:Kef-type K+ transport system membrane component KefB